MPRNVDISARRAARYEAAGEPPTLTFNGHTWVLPVELPLTFVESLQEGQLATACRELLGDDGEEFIKAVRPSIQDLSEIATLYGQSMGE